VAGTVDLSYNILANTARAAAAIEGLAGTLERLSERLDRIDGRRARADVDAETAAAEARLAAVEEQLRRINGQRATAKVDVDPTAGDRLREITGLLGNLAAFRMPAGIVALTPTLISAAQAAADLSGLLGVAAGGMAAAGAVAATLKVGLTGIPEVFKAMGAADKAAADTAAQTGAQRLQIAERIRSAQEGLAVAQETANRRVAGAEDTLAQAQRQSQYAQENLNQARKQAKADLEDLKLSLSGAAISEEAAQIALERAQQHLAEAHAKGLQGLDLREAELGVKEASQALAEAHDRYKDVQQASQEANAAGVEGSKQVVQAQRGVQDANRSVQSAQEGLKQAQVDGARQVSDAQRQLAQALQQTATTGSKASDQLAQAMAKLAPSARDTVLAVRGLKPAWDSLQVDVQQRLFAGLADTVKRLGATELPVLHTGMTGLAGSLNGVAKSLGDFFAKASTGRDIAAIFDNTTKSTGFLGSAVTDVVAVFTDLATVGSGFLPGLAQGFANATAKVREFVDHARETGQLQQWMQLAVDKTEQLGKIAGNVGGILVSVFKAAGQSGGDFLSNVEKITGELDKLLKTPVGQAGVASFFKTINDTIDNLLPGVKALAVQLLNALKVAGDTGGLQATATALSNIASVVAPLIPVITELAGKTLKSLADEANTLQAPLQGIVTAAIAIVNNVGPIGPAVTAAVLAFKGFQVVGASVTALGVTLGRFATSIGVSETASGRLTSALGSVGKYLPIVGAAVVGLMVLYDQMKDKSDALAQSVLDGSLSLTAAVDKESSALQNQTNVMQELGGEGEVVGRGIGDLTGQTNTAATAADTHAEAIKNLLGAMDAQIAQMPPLQAATATVRREQENYTLAVRDYGDKSPQAIDASQRLQKASEDLKTAQKDFADATKTHTDRVLDLWRAENDIVDKDLAYKDSLDRLKDAQDAAAKAVADHGAASTEAERAFRDVEKADIDVARAAGDKAKADADAAGAANGDELAAKAQKDELLRLAAAATGPTRQALLDMANGIDVSKAASNTATLQAGLQKDKLGELAAQVTGPLHGALLDAKTNFDNLGGAHASAGVKAQAQKDELQRLADKANGPVKQALLDMAAQITGLPDKTVWITVNGKMGEMTNFGAIGGPDLVRIAHGGALGGVIKMGPGGLTGVGYDTGGTLPGFTPGRDVHTFVSPTGGVLHLSGGEAIMRPEWARAVGVDYIKKANTSAAMGGIHAVSDMHASGRSVNDIPRPFAEQHFAGGGLFLGGYQPLKDIPEAASLGAGLRVAAAAMPMVIAISKQLIDLFSGGANAQAALDWARTQQGKPYQWGGVGNPSWDCSGFISGILNVMQGRPPNSRRGTTASMPWAGFLSGLGPGLQVGNKPNDHMAGTLLGVNVESSGHGHGVQVGTPAAWGATNPYFTQRWHIGGDGGGGGAPMNIPGGEVQATVQRLAAGYGWGSDGEWNSLAEIIRLESNWDPNAANKTSSARGLFQKMTSLHGPIEPTVAGQTAWGLNYIKTKYGDPNAALAFHRAHGWYGNGGIITRPTFGLLGESGPEMVLPLTRPGRSSELMAAAGMGGDPGLTVNVTTSPYATAERIIQTAMHQARLRRMAGRYGR